MLFNSLAFLFFFIVVFGVYWALKKHLRFQNVLLLAASYFFYGYWDYRFVFLLAFSTLLDYYTALKIHNAGTNTGKKSWLVTSLVINLGFLFVFKYYNFFIDSFAALLISFGVDPHLPVLEIVLPVGISFYTFHGVSYVVDTYYGRVRPTRNIIDYSLFVSFFPLLVAGPIERATHLLPQIEKPRTFAYSKSIEGLRDIVWGLFKKVAVADLCASYADYSFDNVDRLGGSSLALGTFFFAMQIYGDFSGYSDIARGVSKLLGFDVYRNFSYPYFSRDVAEFWRRWHTSLSSWFRDYVYIPLGGSRGGKLASIRNVSIVFLLSGFWHGANWTFIIWGGLNALLFMPSLLLQNNRSHLDTVAADSFFPSLRETFQMLLTFILICFTWVFFRADNLSDATVVIKQIFSPSLFTRPLMLPRIPFVIIALMIGTDWLGRNSATTLNFLDRWPAVIRWLFYFGLVMLIFLMYRRDQSFIYFQF